METFESKNTLLDSIFKGGFSSGQLNVLVGMRNVGKSNFSNYWFEKIKNQILKKNRKRKLYDFITKEYQH